LPVAKVANVVGVDAADGVGEHQQALWYSVVVSNIVVILVSTVVTYSVAQVC